MDFSTNGTKILYLHQSDTTTILKRHHILDFSTDPPLHQCNTRLSVKMNQIASDVFKKIQKIPKNPKM